MDLSLLDRELQKMGIYDGYLENKSFVQMTEMGCFPVRLLDIINCTENDIQRNTLKGCIKSYILNFDQSSREVILKALEGYIGDSNMIGLLGCLAIETGDIAMINLINKYHHSLYNSGSPYLDDGLVPTNLRRMLLDL